MMWRGIIYKTASSPMFPKARCIPFVTLRNISYGHNDHIQTLSVCTRWIYTFNSLKQR